MTSSAQRRTQATTTPSDMVRNMILGQLYTNEIVEPAVIDAIASTNREVFVPSNFKGASYVDDNLDVGNGRSLLAPLTFARLLHLSGVKPQHRVLDIGCLAGYSAAVLSKIAAHVVAIETDADLVAQARKNLSGAANIDLQQVKSLADGYGTSAPYDVIIIEGGINFVPDVLGLQLSEGGCIVTVFRKDNVLSLTDGTGRGMLIKRLQGSLQYREYFDAAASVLPGFAREIGFTL